MARNGTGARLRDALALVPFLAYLVIFLAIPTVTVLVRAIVSNGHFSLDRIRALGSDTVLHTLWRSLVLSGSTAVIGATLGALLAYLIVSSPPTSLFRRTVVSVCSVLAQFGGVALAFAFLATIGFSGVLTVWARDHLGWDIYGSGWLLNMPGMILVYTYFQIPLMLIVFLPAVDGLRSQWREAAETLGGSTWDYWRHVAGPILAPSFIGALLLLFTNAFSAYATAAALVSQGSPIIPLQIGGALSSEVLLGQENVGKAMALGMVVVVAVVMTLYTVLERRTTRWLGR